MYLFMQSRVLWPVHKLIKRTANWPSVSCSAARPTELMKKPATHEFASQTKGQKRRVARGRWQVARPGLANK